MIALIQRVSESKVKIEDEEIASIDKGYLILLGVMDGDGDSDLNYLVQKVGKLRIMADETGKMNLDLKSAKGEVLVVSQFTLAGDVASGNRPSFIKAAEPKLAEKYYQQFVDGLKAVGLPVKTGKFGAYMAVSLVNDGPTTIIINSQNKSWLLLFALL